MRNRALRGCLTTIAALLVTVFIFSKDVGSIAKERIQPHTNPIEHQQPSEADKRGTADAPFIVKTIPSEKSQQEADEDASDKAEKRWNDQVTIFIGIGTASILLLQPFVFGWQAISLRKTVTTMKELGQKQSVEMQASIAVAKESAYAAKKSSDSLISSERAFVSVHQPWWAAIPRIGGGHDYIFGVRWINGGNTPTKGMKTYTDNYLSETKMPDDFVFPNDAPHIATAFLAPKCNPIIGHRTPKENGIPDRTIAAVQAGTKFLYIFGWAKYFDVFPGTPERVTRFCYMILVNGDPFQPRSNGFGINFPIYERYNCADDGCEE
jgi:hypothetical protein